MMLMRWPDGIELMVMVMAVTTRRRTLDVMLVSPHTQFVLMMISTAMGRERTELFFIFIILAVPITGQRPWSCFVGGSTCLRTHPNN